MPFLLDLTLAKRFRLTWAIALDSQFYLRINQQLNINSVIESSPPDTATFKIFDIPKILFLLHFFKKFCLIISGLIDIICYLGNGIVVALLVKWPMIKGESAYRGIVLKVIGVTNFMSYFSIDIFRNPLIIVICLRQGIDNHAILLIDSFQTFPGHTKMLVFLPHPISFQLFCWSSVENTSIDYRIIA